MTHTNAHATWTPFLNLNLNMRQKYKNSNRIYKSYTPPYPQVVYPLVGFPSDKTASCWIKQAQFATRTWPWLPKQGRAKAA